MSNQAPEPGSVWVIRRGRHKGRPVRVDGVTPDVVWFTDLHAGRPEHAPTYMDRAWFLTYYAQREEATP